MSAKRFFKTIAARFRSFFSAHVSGNAKDLTGLDMSGVSDLVSVCPVK
jgi:hypothetical protein